MNDKKLGENLVYVLQSIAESDEFDSEIHELRFEDDSGRDSGCNVDIRTVCGEAAEHINHLLELLDLSLGAVNTDVLGPDSRCTPDWFVEAALLTKDIKNNMRINDIVDVNVKLTTTTLPDSFGDELVMGGKMKHTFEKHDPCCESPCHICDGGLLHCTVCKGAESSLTTDCCERVLSSEEQIGVANGDDYINGKWVRVI